MTPGAGFERGEAIGDFDGDGDVDRYDYVAAQICLGFTGPDGLIPPACAVFDFDGDDDVDLEDLAAFMNALTEPLSHVLVEAGAFPPAVAPRSGYFYSGEPGIALNVALTGHAAQSGYTQDDLWFAWGLASQPEQSGAVIITNASLPATAYYILEPALAGDYVFRLTVINLVTGESGMDAVTLQLVECLGHFDCDDGVFCNGAEVCEEGACVIGTPPCAGQVVCNESTDSCDAVTLCEVDADCDDGAYCTVDSCSDGQCINESLDCDDGYFCTGPETCNEVTDHCESSGDPCAEDELCNEATDRCDTDKPCGAFLFTFGNDDFIGSDCADTFEAYLAFNPPTGTNLPTLQSSDRADGGDGVDTLAAHFDAGANNVTLLPTLTNIEVWNITDFGAAGGGATTLSAINSTGLTFINSLHSTDDAVTVTNVNSLVDFGVYNTASDLLVRLVAPSTNTNADESTLTLVRARPGCTVTVTTPVNGIETLNVVSEGTVPNVLDALTQAAGTTLTTLNVSGSQALTIHGPLNTTLTMVNAGAASGNIQLSLAENTNNVTYTGGGGNDSINFGGGYTTSDIINGGGGTNTLGLSSAQAVAAGTQQANLIGINTIHITDSLSGAVNVTRFGPSVASAARDAILDTTAPATALTAGASTITLGSGSRNITLNNDDTAHTLNTVVSGAGTTDTLTVNLQNADLGAATTFTGAETVGVVSGNGSDGTAADGNANTGTAVTLTPTFGAGTLNLSGSVAVTLTGAVTAATINAGSLTAAFTMGAETVAGGGAVITGSGLNDVLFGSANSDSISGGNGNDRIIGRAGGDSVIGGNGVDTFQYQQTTDGGAANADNVGMDRFNDFVPGAGSDVFAFQDNVFFTDNHTVDLDIIIGAAAGNVVTGLTDGGATSAQVIVQTTPLTNFAAVATLFTAIDGVITTSKAIVITEVSGVGTFIFWDGATGAADGEQVLGQLVGVTGANLASVVAANFALNDG